MPEYKTKDVSLAAFFRYKGITLLYYNIPERKPDGTSYGASEKKLDGEYVFDMSKDEAELLKIEYSNSEFASYEGFRRGLNKLKYG